MRSKGVAIIFACMTVVAFCPGTDGAGTPQGMCGGGGTVLTVSPAEVRLVQQRLNQLGYDAGNVDGIWGKKTATAAYNYQQAAGMEPTGWLTLRTLQSLGLLNAIGVPSVEKTAGPPPRSIMD